MIKLSGRATMATLDTVVQKSFEMKLELCLITKRASDVITQANSHKQNGKVEDLRLFQARGQVFLKQFLKRKFGVNFPPISLGNRL